MYIKPDWPAPLHVKACTTLRDTWQEKNALRSLLKLPADPIWLKQTHGVDVIRAIPENQGKEADASFADEPERVCVVTTADCLPLLICNQEGTMVGAIHAGWRGLSAGVIEATLSQLPPDKWLVWLGPAIGPHQFEVGQDVYHAFVSQHSESARAFQPIRENQWLANLYELARIRLTLCGLSQIFGGNFCTYSQQELFYSYRRDRGITGRMASLIWIDHHNK